MSEAHGPTPPEQPKQEVPPTEAPPLSSTEAVQPPLREVVATPDASAETASLAQLQTLRAQYTGIRTRAQSYIDIARASTNSA